MVLKPSAASTSFRCPQLTNESQCRYRVDSSECLEHPERTGHMRRTIHRGRGRDIRLQEWRSPAPAFEGEHTRNASSGQWATVKSRTRDFPVETVFRLKSTAVSDADRTHENTCHDHAVNNMKEMDGVASGNEVVEHYEEMVEVESLGDFADEAAAQEDEGGEGEGDVDLFRPDLAAEGAVEWVASGTAFRDLVPRRFEMARRRHHTPPSSDNIHPESHNTSHPAGTTGDVIEQQQHVAPTRPASVGVASFQGPPPRPFLASRTSEGLAQEERMSVKSQSREVAEADFVVASPPSVVKSRKEVSVIGQIAEAENDAAPGVSENADDSTLFEPASRGVRRSPVESEPITAAPKMFRRQDVTLEGPAHAPPRPGHKGPSRNTQDRERSVTSKSDYKLSLAGAPTRGTRSALADDDAEEKEDWSSTDAVQKRIEKMREVTRQMRCQLRTGSHLEDAEKNSVGPSASQNAASGEELNADFFFHERRSVKSDDLQARYREFAARRNRKNMNRKSENLVVQINDSSKIPDPCRVKDSDDAGAAENANSSASASQPQQEPRTGLNVADAPVLVKKCSTTARPAVNKAKQARRTLTESTAPSPKGGIVACGPRGHTARAAKQYKRPKADEKRGKRSVAAPSQASEACCAPLSQATAPRSGNEESPESLLDAVMSTGDAEKTLARLLRLALGKELLQTETSGNTHQHLPQNEGKLESGSTASPPRETLDTKLNSPTEQQTGATSAMTKVKSVKEHRSRKNSTEASRRKKALVEYVPSRIAPDCAKSPPGKGDDVRSSAPTRNFTETYTTSFVFNSPEKNKGLNIAEQSIEVESKTRAGGNCKSDGRVDSNQQRESGAREAADNGGSKNENKNIEGERLAEESQGDHLSQSGSNMTASETRHSLQLRSLPTKIPKINVAHRTESKEPVADAANAVSADTNSTAFMENPNSAAGAGYKAPTSTRMSRSAGSTAQAGKPEAEGGSGSSDPVWRTLMFPSEIALEGSGTSLADAPAPDGKSIGILEEETGRLGALRTTTPKQQIDGDKIMRSTSRGTTAESSDAEDVRAPSRVQSHGSARSTTASSRNRNSSKRSSNQHNTQTMQMHPTSSKSSTGSSKNVMTSSTRTAEMPGEHQKVHRNDSCKSASSSRTRPTSRAPSKSSESKLRERKAKIERELARTPEAAASSKTEQASGTREDRKALELQNVREKVAWLLQKFRSSSAAKEPSEDGSNHSTTTSLSRRSSKRSEQLDSPLEDEQQNDRSGVAQRVVESPTGGPVSDQKSRRAGSDSTSNPHQTIAQKSRSASLEEFSEQAPNKQTIPSNHVKRKTRVVPVKQSTKLESKPVLRTNGHLAATQNSKNKVADRTRSASRPHAREAQALPSRKLVCAQKAQREKTVPQPQYDEGKIDEEPELPSKSRPFFPNRWSRLAEPPVSKQVAERQSDRDARAQRTKEEQVEAFKPAPRVIPKNYERVKPRYLQSADDYVVRMHNILQTEALEQEERRILVGLGLPAPPPAVASDDEREMRKKFKAAPAPKFHSQVQVRGCRNHVRLQEAARCDRERKKQIVDSLSLRNQGDMNVSKSSVMSVASK
ncbi:unnamed protein product [Amoebophrya sp. A25]|nr:unnamed protein product [Amoebophrya sp. A25]|eukprot:GSA25T00001190001.1